VHDDAALLTLMRALAVHDQVAVQRLLTSSPTLARASVQRGASRTESTSWFLADIGYALYAGTTALHVAAAAHDVESVNALLTLGADVLARNRRGAQPLHAAAVGRPDVTTCNPIAQAATLVRLLAVGADVHVLDGNGAAALHRAVRTRSSAAVRALLDGGADARAANGNGTTPLTLAHHNTGRSGSGSPEAKREQAEIVRVLEQWLAQHHAR
jgi:hypothetical protein